jgi:hypothetical protein
MAKMEATIHNREQLLSLVAKRIVYVYIKRAIQDGPVEHLGGFSPVFPDDIHKGWIVKITTRTKRVLYVAVTADDLERCYKIELIEEVCWRNWCGDQCYNNVLYKNNKLFTGDNPEEYMALKKQEIENELQAEDD